MKRSFGEQLFDGFNYTLLIVIGFITLYPFIYVCAASVSTPDAVITGRVLLFPVGFELTSYQKILSQNGIWIAYANTIYYAVVGTLVSLFITICGAYPLSKKRLMGKKILSYMVLITMWFNAGMMPTYLNLKNLGLLDKRNGLIIAFACSAFYVILMRTYFESIPESMEESAKIDGAHDMTILAKIYLPLSTPAIITIGLYYLVERWNSYFWAMVLLTDKNKIPLQVLLKKLVVEMTMNKEFAQTIDVTRYSNETIIYATIIVAIVPIIVVYPYIQKFFVKGVMVGSIKS